MRRSPSASPSTAWTTTRRARSWASRRSRCSTAKARSPSSRASARRTCKTGCRAFVTRWLERQASRSSKLTTSRKTRGGPPNSFPPNRAAWPAVTGNPLDAVDPDKTKVISFDTIDPALDLLREGKVQVLLGQKYFGWGSESVKLLRDIKNGKQPAAAVIDSGVDVVTKENVEQYAEQWKRMAAGK